MSHNGSVEKPRAPNGWINTTLGVLVSAPNCFIQTGPFGSQLHKHDYQGAGIGVVNPTHMLGNKISHDEVPRISAETASRLERHRLAVDDILFARRGEIGRHGLVTASEDGWLCGTGCFLVRIRRRDVENQFLSYFFSNRETVEWLNRHAAGVVMPNLNNSVLQGLPISFPPIDEQRKIVAVLGLVQRATEQQERLLVLTAELKKGLLDQLFTRGLCHEPQKQTEIGPIPQSWQVVELGSLVKETEKVNVRREGTRRIEYVDVSGISREFLRIESSNSYQLKDAPGRARKKIKEGDVIFATVRPTLLRVARVPKEFDDQVCSTAFCVLRDGSKETAGRFIYYVVQRKQFLKQLAAIESGASYPAVTDRQLLAQKIPKPSEGEQLEVAQYLEACDARMRLAADRKKSLTDLFRTLLHELMTARIRVHDLDLEQLQLCAR